MSQDRGSTHDQFLREQADKAHGLIDKITDAHAQDVKQDVARDVAALEDFIKFIKAGMRATKGDGDQ